MDGFSAFTGTAYGMMVGTKMTILALILVLGALNFFVVRRLPSADPVSLLRLRRFVEVELGLGITVLFAAASLTSLPPAVDVVADRATISEVAHIFTPRVPAFTSPRLEDMPLDDREAPRTDADRQWSEFNHNVAGRVRPRHGPARHPPPHRPGAVGAALAAHILRAWRSSSSSATTPAPGPSAPWASGRV